MPGAPTPLSNDVPLSSDPVFAMPGDPASRKCNIADPDTGNDSPIKRAQSSEGGSAFSFSTRMQLEKLYGTACWHCSSLFAYNAHVIAQADKSLANSMEVGLVNLQGHRDVNNALRLCPNCHVAYDDPDPKLIIVPYDLAFFKEAEERWQENYRITRAARPPVTGLRYGQHCVSKYQAVYNDIGNIFWNDGTVIRTMPSGPGRLYQCYIGEQNYLDREAGPEVCDRVWHGDPGAFLRRVMKRIVSVKQPSQDLLVLKEELCKLGVLYDRGNSLLTCSVTRLSRTRSSTSPDSSKQSGSSKGRGRPQLTPGPNLYPSMPGQFPDASGQNESTTSASNTRNASGSGTHSLAFHPLHKPVLASIPDSPPDVLSSLDSHKRKRSSIENRSESDEDGESFRSSEDRPLVPGIKRLFRWGGPQSTTEATVEYWNRDVLGPTGQV
jgi:hypothetical protein